MPDKLSVRRWQEVYRSGVFDMSDPIMRERMGWYSWECPVESLAMRTEKLADIVMGITDPYILDHFGISFRNLSSRFEKLYDEVGFWPFQEEDRSKGFWVTLDDPYHRRTWSLFTYRYGLDGPEFDCEDVREIIRYIDRSGPVLKRGGKPAFVAERRAVEIYAHRYHGEPWGLPVYRDGAHRYSYRFRQDGREHMVMAAAGLDDMPPGFDSKLAEDIKGVYVYCPEDGANALPTPEKAVDRSQKRKKVPER